jgi:hypothetical protein
MSRRFTMAGCAIVLLAVIVFFYSCHKNAAQPVNDPDGFAKKASDWFSTTVVAPETKMLSLPFSVLAQNSDARRFARMGRIQRILQWGDARLYNEGGIKYIVVPLDESIKPFKNKKFEFFRDLIIYADKSGTMKMAVIEVLGKENTTLGDDLQSLVHTAFRNKFLGQSEKLASVDASVIFYGRNYSLDQSFVVQAGTMKAAKAAIRTYKRSSLLPVPSVQSIKDGSILATPMKTIADAGGCGCSTTYTVGVTYDINTGEIYGVDILDESSDCGNIHAGDGDNPGGNPAPPDPDCVNAAMETFAGLMDVSTASEIVDNGISQIDALTKNYNPVWTCLKNVTWLLRSTEKGTVKLIDQQNMIWQWQSLTHDKIALVGFVLPGASVDIVQESGTPSFTEGTTNILVAGMKLDFTVKYSYVCNCNGVNPFYVQNAYQSTCFFNAAANQ